VHISDLERTSLYNFALEGDVGIISKSR